MWKEIANILQQLVGIGYVDQKVKGSRDYEGTGHQGNLSCETWLEDSHTIVYG